MREKWKTIFCVKEKGGRYKITYDEELDSGLNLHKLPGALFLLMMKYPELIEEIVFAGTRAADELIKPFNEILNDERPSKK